MSDKLTLEELEKRLEALQAECAAIESENTQYRQLMENLNDIVYTIDRDATITYISPNVERIAGYTPQELIGRSYRGLIGPDDMESLGKTFARVLAGEEVVTEHQYITRNRGAVWALSRVRPIYEKQAIVGVQGTLLDITERKEAERLVRSSEEKYRQIIENSGDMVFTVDEEGKFLYISHNCETILGYPQQEFLGMGFDQFVHPDDIEIIYNAILEVFEEYRRSDGTRVDQKVVEYRALAKNGKWKWLSAKNTVLKEADGVFELGCIARDVTEQKMAAEALRQSEAKYRELVANARDVFYSLDLDGNFLDVNEAFLNEGGWPREEIIGSNFQALIDPGEMPAALEAFGKCINGQIAQFEMQVRKKDGRFGWYSFVNRPLYGSNARITGVTGIARNIDDRKSVEVALRESEQQKNLILNATSEMITYYDEDLRIIWTNQAAAKSVNSLPEDLIGQHCYEIWQQRSEPCPQCPVLRTKETGKPEKLEKQTPDGRHWFIRGYPVMGEEGRVTAFVEFTQEVTPHREAEAALRESEERFSIAFKSSPAPLVISEIETGLFLNVNDRWIEMLEFSRKELIGRRSKDVGIWDEPTERDRIVKKLRTNGRFRDEPIVFRTKSRRTIQALWSAEAINISGKEVMLSMITDITELKHAEKERERLREQLSQAQKMESIGRLAGGVAHDLNNLLSPILGYGEMLCEDADPDDPRRKPVEEIVNAGKRAQALVRQLLAFSRKQPLQFQPLDVNMLLKDFKKLLRRTLREDVRIQMKLDKTIPQVEGDAGQLEQVVMNLSVNAQDAMPEGGVLIIETSHLELDEAYARQKKGVKPGYYVKVAISDTGAGMGAETLERMFEPFYTTKDTGKGTGLGMSTAYGIIKQHGGNIWAYSELGLGTTVKVYLPALMEPVDLAKRSEPAAAVTKGEETILLVEDDHQVRDLSKTILQRYGYNVLVAGSGEEALQILAGREEEIHLLLTDVVMPDINGKSLFEKVSAARPGTRVLYMSGYTDDVIAHHGVIDPDVAFLEKPFSIEGLAAKVREVLDK